MWQIFRQRGTASPAGESVLADDRDALRSGLAALVQEQLARGGIPSQLAQLEVRQQGEAADGLPVFAAMLRLTAWDSPAAVRLLLGLPLLERHVRRALHGHWVAEASHFAGLWVHPSTRLLDRATLHEVSVLVQHVEASLADPGPRREGPASRAAWPVPAGDTDLGTL